MTVNAPPWDFGRLLGIYVTLFFLLAQLINWFGFGQQPTLPIVACGALIIAGGELVLALILVLFAARSSPGRVEVEALAVRRRALEAARSGLAFSALLTQLLPLTIRLWRRR